MDKQTLRQYRYLVKEIDQIEEEKTRLIASLVGAQAITDMPTSNSYIKDRMAEVTCKTIDLTTTLADKLNEVATLRREIEDCFDKLEPRDRLLMRYHYIDGWKWEKVAVEMDYDYRWVTRLHGRILQKLK